MPIAAPTYRIEANFASTLTGYLVVGVGYIGVDKLGGEFADSGWADVTTRVLGFETKRGREGALSGTAVGTMQADLLDSDGALDPENAGGPYWPNMKLMRRWRIVANYNGVDYGLHYGFATDLAAEPVAVDATVAVQTEDLMTRMGRPRADYAYPPSSLTIRIHLMLNQLLWTSISLRSIELTPFMVPAETVGEDVTMLENLDAILKAERGRFFIAGNGTVTYHARHHRLTRVSRGTFGIGGIPIQDIELSYNDSGVFSEVKVKRTAGVEQTWNEATSLHDYDSRVYRVPTASANYLVDDADAFGLAKYVISQTSQPLERIKSITLVPDLDPDTIWPHVLGAELGDLITITHNVPGTKGVIVMNCFIESINHTWSYRHGHQVVWGLSRAAARTSEYLIIGDSVRGYLDNTWKVAY